MYTRSEVSRLKQEFWIAFGKYIALHANSEGEKINWVNYHTGHKNVYFRMEAGKNNASISIQITHADFQRRNEYFTRFQSFRTLIRNGLNEEWLWKEGLQDETGKVFDWIGIELPGVNVLEQATWPEIISFLKPRIIALDEVWNLIKDGFEDLR